MNGGGKITLQPNYLISQSPDKVVQNSNKNTLYQWHDIITEDPVMIEQIEIAQKAARTTYPIMVYGEVTISTQRSSV